MKTISDHEAPDLESLLDSAQEERIVITRKGRPSALIFGLESYDAADLSLASSPSFWKMIERRRRQGSAITLAEAKARLEAKERRETG